MISLDPVSEKIHDTIQKAEPSHRIVIGLCFFMDHSLGDQSQIDLMLEAVEYADRSGFHFAWVVDEYLNASTDTKLNPAILHSALSVRTSRIELRGECLASAKRDVIRTAEDWSIIDNLSNGRVGLLMPYYLDEPPFGNLFMKQANELKDLWKGNTVSRINGVGNEIELKIFPRPMQEQLPIWVTITGDACASSFGKAGELEFNLLTSYADVNHQKWSSNIEQYRKGVALSKHGSGQGKVSVVVELDDRTEADESSDRKEAFPVTVDNVMGCDNFPKSADGSLRISENEFFEFYANIKKIDSGINEIAVKIDLTQGREAAFKQLKKLEKCFNF